MSTTAAQDREFLRAVISSSLLEEAMAWIAKNMEPEDVFDRKTLENWAIDNGYSEERT
jgi:hypothetical protein